MSAIEKLKESLKPTALYLLPGPFDSETLLIVVEKDRMKDIEEFLESEDIDYDVAVVDAEEFENMRESIEKRGRKIW